MSVLMTLRQCLVFRGMMACLGFFLLMTGASSVHAHPLPAPEEDVMLTVAGDISRTNGDGVARFDRAMLQELPQGTIVTHTPWTEGASHFEGPLLGAIYDAVGASGDSLHVIALNDFAADVPLAEAKEYGVILAMRRDGEPMPVREYGPLFVLYPFDEHPELQTEEVRFRSVWQVARIVVE
ncbi:oxidoreductase [Chromohalobacter canadensis]|uniref:oxidoreductase n=1 Tax=Chromohalobacter canadensis TaxID=141389 RepID=UPI00240ED3EC|nr:oxidoreductase [Chromohalobacter canadensis]